MVIFLYYEIEKKSAIRLEHIITYRTICKCTTSQINNFNIF
jgi:hypothetical protein